MLNQSKRTTLRSKINDCHGDSRKLHQLVNNLTNKIVENPMPPNKSDAELAEELTIFFENKILTIRDLFQGIPHYQSIPQRSQG